jgi:hypothetical protein
MEGGGGDILSFFSHSNYLLASRATKSSILHCDTFLVFDVLLEFLEKTQIGALICCLTFDSFEEKKMNPIWKV